MSKLIMSTVVIFFSLAAFAKGEKKAEKFQERKTKVQANIDKRIDSLNQLKSCVSGAADKDAMKACRKANKERMKAIRPERKRGQGHNH